jgi:hypothetical protein
VTPEASLLLTLLLSPPALEDLDPPQVTTEPSLFNAAKAVAVENI